MSESKRGTAPQHVKDEPRVECVNASAGYTLPPIRFLPSTASWRVRSRFPRALHIDHRDIALSSGMPLRSLMLQPGSARLNTLRGERMSERI